MANNLSEGPLQVCSNDVSSLNAILEQIRRELDQLKGLRGPISLFDILKFNLTKGAVLFGGSSGEIKENKTSFFWDDANKSLGLRTNAPTNTVDVGAGGTVRIRDMTQGSVPFIGADGVISQDNASFFWDNTANALWLGPRREITGDPFGGTNRFLRIGQINVSPVMLLWRQDLSGATPPGAITGAIEFWSTSDDLGVLQMGVVQGLAVNSLLANPKGTILFFTRNGASSFEAARLTWDRKFGINSLGVDPTESLDVFSGNVRIRTLTSGSVLFAGPDGVVSQNNSKLFWDNVNFRLGVGTAVPTAPIAVELGAGLPAAYIQVTSTRTEFILTKDLIFSKSVIFGMSNPSAPGIVDDLLFLTYDGVGPWRERFRIGNSAGQWGIGGANFGTIGQYFRSGGAAVAPTWSTIVLTDLAAFSSADLLGRLTDETGSGLAVFNNTPTLLTPTIAAPILSGTATGTYTLGGSPTITPIAGVGLAINLSTTGDLAVNTNQLYVDTSEGRVGIGTTSPAAKLHVPAGGFLQDEEADLAAPAANRVIVYARDNGAGKTQWVGRFNTGAVQVLITEP